MNIRQMQYVIVIAEERSFSKAAKRLHISQPSLSQFVRNLEKTLEIELFNRSVTPIALTEMGEEYVRTAQKIIALEANLMKCISDYRDNSVSRLNVGVSAYLNTGEISQTLAEMRMEYPGVKIYMHELFSVTMDAMIEQGELDFSISPIKDSYDTTAFHRDIVSQDRFFLAISREMLSKHLPELKDAENGDVVRLEQFKDVPFLTMAERSLQTYSTNVAATAAGFVPNTILRCRRWEMLQELVEESVGATLLTDRFLLGRKRAENVVLFNLDPPAPNLVGTVSYQRGAYLPKAARAFISCYKRIVGQTRDENGYLTIKTV